MSNLYIKTPHLGLSHGTPPFSDVSEVWVRKLEYVINTVPIVKNAPTPKTCCGHGYLSGAIPWQLDF